MYPRFEYLILLPNSGTILLPSSGFTLSWPRGPSLQGVGGPCCARILTTWFAGKERGTYWGMWNIAHNLGGFAAPLIAGGFAKSMGWQWGMWAPGIIGLLVGVVVLLSAR